MQRKGRSDRPSGWSLYWVTSDGLEDCFVVARNSRSARRVELDMNGFEPDDVEVYRVAPIPLSIARSFPRRSKTESVSAVWPWYADRWLLKRMGAQFRELDGCEEVRIGDVVYTSGAVRPIAPRSIGRKAIRELRQDLLGSYGDEDSFTPSQLHLMTMLGICVARCQEIEYLIAHSYLLGLSENQKRQFETVNDLMEGWKKKTLGQLLGAIREAYEIEPTVNASLELFLSMRNQLVHGLTTHPRYDVGTPWGQDELVAFLTFFEILSRPVRKAFRASFYAGVEFAVFQRDGPNATPATAPLTRKQRAEVELFFAFFTPRAAAE